MADRMYLVITSFSVVDNDIANIRWKVVWHLQGTGPEWRVNYYFRGRTRRNFNLARIARFDYFRVNTRDVRGTDPFVSLEG